MVEVITASGQTFVFDARPETATDEWDRIVSVQGRARVLGTGASVAVVINNPSHLVWR